MEWLPWIKERDFLSMAKDAQIENKRDTGQATILSDMPV